MPYSAQKLTLLESWLKADMNLKNAKAIEASLRSDVVQAFSHRKFSRMGEDISGTENISVSTDLLLKINHRVLYDFSVDRDGLVAHLDEMSKTIPGPLVERLVSWKPSLVVSEYKKLSRNSQRFMQEILNIREGSKDVSLKQPDNEVKDFLSTIRTKE